MSQVNRTYLKSKFETGDLPTQNDFANLIDSYANIVECDIICPQIESTSSWDGSSLTISMCNCSYMKRTVVDGTTSLTFALSFATDSDTTCRTVILEVDNTSNNSAISTIIFDDNSGSYIWDWEEGLDPSGMASLSKARLMLTNTSDTEVMVNWRV